jgi:hypothetical protein
MLRVSTHWKNDGTGASLFVEDVSRNKCFSMFECDMIYILYKFVTYLLTLPRIEQDSEWLLYILDSANNVQIMIVPMCANEHQATTVITHATQIQ